MVYNRMLYNKYCNGDYGKLEEEDGGGDDQSETHPTSHISSGASSMDISVESSVASSMASSIDILVGTAGTVTTLAAMDMGVKSTKDYNPTRVDGYTLSYLRVKEYLDILKTMTNRERLLKYPVLEIGREDVITVGVVIVAVIMKVFEMEILTVSDSGLLEGMVLNLLG
jgi:exopolyphosphatase/pppGpp-phosphohydrolase